MYKFNFFSLLIFFSILSCSDNDDSTNNDTISFSQAYLSTVDRSEDGYNFQVFLMGPNRMVDLNQYPAILGTGPLLTIQGWAEYENNLPKSGLYSSVNGIAEPYSIDWAVYQTSEIFTHVYNDSFVMGDDGNGTLEISYQDDQIILTYNFNLISTDTEDTKQISGVYNQQVVITDEELY